VTQEKSLLEKEKVDVYVKVMVLKLKKLVNIEGRVDNTTELSNKYIEI